MAPKNERRLKILVTTAEPVYPIRSGYTDIIDQITQHLNRRGHRVFHISSYERPVAPQLWKAGASQGGLIRALLSINWRVVRMNLNIGYLVQLIRKIRSEGFDLVQVEGFWPAPIACLAARLAGVPSIVHDYNVPTYPTNPYGRAMRVLGHLIMDLTFRLAHMVTVTLEIEKEFLESHGYPVDRVRVVPVGVNFQKFESMDEEEIQRARGSLGFDRDKVLAVFTGDFAWPPNLEAARMISDEIAPRVASRTDRVRFILIGAGLEGMRLHPHVSYLGRVKSTGIMKAADIGLSPLRSGGGPSLKTMEYLSAGIPVVTTTFGARGLDVRSGAHLYTEDTSDRLADRIIQVAADPEASRSMAREGRRIMVEKYGWEGFVDMLEECYRQLV